MNKTCSFQNIKILDSIEIVLKNVHYIEIPIEQPQLNTEVPKIPEKHLAVNGINSLNNGYGTKEETAEVKRHKDDKIEVHNSETNNDKAYSIFYVGDGQGDEFNRMYVRKFHSEAKVGPKYIRGGGGGSSMSYPPTEGEVFQYDPESRNQFVRKVLLIVLIMLIATAVFAAVVYLVDPIRDFFIEFYLFLLGASFIILISVVYAFYCSSCSRRFPGNIIVLFLTTLGMSILVALISIMVETEILLYSFITTAVVTGVCFAIAYSKFDFTSYMLYIYGVSIVFSVVSALILLTLFVLKIKMTPLQIGLLVISALIQCVVFIMELQMVIGGKSVEIGEEEYGFAAYLIYTAIIQLFLTIVRILQLATGD